MSFRDLFGWRRGDQGIGSDSAPRNVDPVEADRRVIEELSHAGADLSASREVVHYLYAPSEEAAEALAAIVRNDGHDTEVVGPEFVDRDRQRPWLVRATSSSVVSEEGVAAARRRFTELAAEHGAEYDGWEAAV